MTNRDSLTSSAPPWGVGGADTEPVPPPVERAVLALDNVLLNLPIAGVGSRVLAASLDYALLALLVILWLLVCSMVSIMAGSLSGGWVVAILIVGTFLLQWGYFAGLEIAMGGRTPGKLAVNLRVVTHQGGRVSALALLIRNLLRTVDNLVAVPMLVLDRRCRRLGDMVAGTLVVHSRTPSAEEIVVARTPAAWGAREVSVVESFLRRAERLQGEHAERLATRLLSWIEREDPAFLITARSEGAVQAEDDALTTLRAVVMGGAGPMSEPVPSPSPSQETLPSQETPSQETDD